MAEPIVRLAALGIREDLIGVGGLLELLLGLGIVSVDVGVELPREPAECLLDLAIGGVPLDAQHLVVVALGHLADPSRRYSS